MEGCYLTTLPKKVVRALAGFNPDGGEFFLKRAQCTIPEDLQELVFPGVEEAQRQLSRGGGDEIAGQGFVRLVLFLREVFIQDSVLLRRSHPDHPSWLDDLFTYPTYLEFASELERKLEVDVDDGSFDKSFKAVAPRLCNAIESGFAQTNFRITALEGSMQRALQELRRFADGKFTVSFAPQVSSQHATDQAAADLKQYRMSRGLKTVQELWAEYSCGINGGPAVRDLERAHGAKWRKVESERQYFCRRKAMYDGIERIATERSLTIEAVVERFEFVRAKRNISLDRLVKDVKAKGGVAIFDSLTTD